MMRSRAWSLAALVGGVGIAMTVPGFLPPLGQSILLGSSIGLIVVGPVRGLAIPKPSMPKQPPEDKLRGLVKARDRERGAQREETLDSFDSLLEKVEDMDDPAVKEKLVRNFDRFVGRLTAHYPEWDAEGRLRTYVLMEKIGNSLSLQNADVYLGLAYQTLVARGAEATEISHETLNGKVRRMYLDPRSEWTRYLAGTLILMNREDEEYAKEMVADAIHLWSDERFDRSLPDFKAVRQLPDSTRREVEDMVEKEMEKARTAGDVGVILRAREIMESIILSRREQPRRDAGPAGSL
ncbi:MAG: hypothetical protein JRN69_07825 [Nitrososphaerota archaeon]|nr:hypothetical protein [Nitrososphaerota archaeon]